MNKQVFGTFIRYIGIATGVIVICGSFFTSMYFYEMDKIRDKQKQQAELIQIIDSRIEKHINRVKKDRAC